MIGAVTRVPWQGFVALVLALLALFSSAFTQIQIDNIAAGNASLRYPYDTSGGLMLGLVGAAAVVTIMRLRPAVEAALLLVLVHLAAWLLLSGIAGAEGSALSPFYLVLVACWLLAWRLVSVLSSLRPKERALDIANRLLIPALFGVWILVLWEALVRGPGVPFILLPPPSAIWLKLISSIPTIAADVGQTILKSMLIGYLLGCAGGFAVAILADRYEFLRRALLPLGNMVSALPLIGIAPIMVMWFGFDWHSKAAVVILMTFFPMLVNTVVGLTAAGHMERDLMRTYASGYWQTLAKLRLPAAMPFIFNALKINSTLALIGAIVAEFFGTPVVGMGFRISTEVGRMNVDMVWAVFAVAALIGSVFYGVIALAERAVTFWHPSVRGG